MTAERLVLVADTVRPLAREVYDRDRAAMVDVLADLGATSVYEIGSVGAPGISDLDLIACFGDDVDLRPAKAAMAPLLRSSSTLLHPPWAIRARHMASLPSLFAVRQMRDLLGGGSLVAEQSRFQRMLWNLEACAGVLATFVGRRRITTRSALCLLNGVRYNLELAAVDEVVAPGGSEFAAGIATLRQDWFGTAADLRERRILELWAQALLVLRGLLDGYGVQVAALARHRATDAMLQVPGTRTLYYFTEGRAPGLVLTRPLSTVLALPQALGSLFRALALPDTGLHRWLHVNLVDEGEPVAFAPEFAAAVRDYARANADYLAEMAREGSPFLLLGGSTCNRVHLTARGRLLGLLQRLGASLVRS